ncbi:uncharacterized protein LOC123560099 isoform X1 [Mercenaria mercenaria]|uniref:uncharacterized protein LOC123560099 isoform X1 n=2 Tax=Mercenaria mercenaria TaxID=6596 RepID=UPI00234E8D16|nr:uncharacterized protein LOC123560099 isoform X1 [Mercenaria mercenaria]XP_053380592.1 uncharacterized protein LOC123560099 isoform X1 [Mercenaria mercenaria]
MTIHIDLDADRRETVLRRMCKLSVVVLFVGLASLLVGIIAVVYSGSKFPYNAGGGIIAGIVACLLSICPMCMLLQSWRYKKYRKSSYDCCIMSLCFWGLFAMLGIIFGLAVNGIGALLGCHHRSKETGCWKNKESQFALAILTVILTSILLIVITAIFVICCCNCRVLSDLSYLSSTDYAVGNDPVADIRERRIHQLSNIDQTPGFTVIPSLHFTENNSHGTAQHRAEPTAPPFALDSTDTRYRSGEYADETINSDVHNSVVRGSGYTHRYEDPPPSYEEVMERDPMETPL